MKDTIEVNAGALRELLVAASGGSVAINEYRVCCNFNERTGKVNNLQLLINQYNTWTKTQCES